MNTISDERTPYPVDDTVTFSIGDGDTKTHINTSALAEHYAVKAEKKSRYLVSLIGPSKGQLVPMSSKAETVSFGRALDNDIMVSDDTVSSHHARIEYHPTGQISLLDLSSKNGTYVAGKKIKRHFLQDGDYIFLGRDTLFKFVHQGLLERSMHNSILESSYNDALTGIYNRRYFMHKLDEILSLCRRHALPMGLLFIDLDHFKSINDTYGHPTGDKLLVTISQNLKGVLRVEDLLARYGGEEFIVVAIGSSLQGIKILADRLRTQVGTTTIETMATDENSIGVTASLGGVACNIGPRSIFNAEALIHTADKNLYKAKGAGRNTFIVSQFDF